MGLTLGFTQHFFLHVSALRESVAGALPDLSLQSGKTPWGENSFQCSCYPGGISGSASRDFCPVVAVVVNPLNRKQISKLSALFCPKLLLQGEMAHYLSSSLPFK